MASRDPNMKPRESYKRFSRDEAHSFLVNLVGDLLLDKPKPQTPSYHTPSQSMAANEADKEVFTRTMKKQLPMQTPQSNGKLTRHRERSRVVIPTGS